MAHHIGEHPQLRDRTPALAFDSPLRKTCLGHAASNEFVAEFEDILCDRVEKVCSALQIDLAKCVEGFIGMFDRKLQFRD